MNYTKSKNPEAKPHLVQIKPEGNRLDWGEVSKNINNTLNSAL